MPVKHQFQSGRADNGDAGAVQPSQWNADHELTGLLALLDGLGPSPNTLLSIDGTGSAVLTPTSTFAPIYSPVFTGVPTAPTANSAVNSTQIATCAFVQTAITNLIGGAPGALSTLNELAAAIDDNSSYAATVTAALAVRLRVDATQGLSGGQQAQGRSNLGLATVAATGNYSDLIGAPASNTPATLAQAQAGTDNTVMMTPLQTANAIAIRATRGHLWGLNCSNDGTSPLTVLDIALGEAASQNGWLMSAAAFTKNCNAAWAVGTGNGALDSGSALVASKTYHVFQIMRTDTWVVDYVISLNTVPALPSGYTECRRIFSIVTDASAHILQFKQVGDNVYWQTVAQDVNDATMTNNNVDVTINLTVPTGIRVTPFVNAGTSTPTNTTGLTLRSPDLQPAPSQADGSTGTNTYWYTETNGSTTTRMSGVLINLMTNTQGQLVARTISSGASPTYFIFTIGYHDTRGRLF